MRILLLTAAAAGAFFVPGSASAIGVCAGADVHVTDTLTGHHPYTCYPSIVEPLPPMVTKECVSEGTTTYPGASFTICVGTWD